MRRIGAPRRSMAPSLGNVAPAIVITAECDVLHDDGERTPRRCSAPACRSSTRNIRG